jgi:hypothetical protein
MTTKRIRIVRVPKQQHGATAWNIGNTVYVSPSANKTDILHEKAHALLDKDSKVHRPSRLAHQEIRADKYAYDETSNPKHIKRHLRGIFYDAVRGNDGYSKLKPTNREGAIKAIDSALKRNKVPEAWHKDWHEFKKEISKAYNKNKGNSEFEAKWGK